jgi:uncharacterized protein YbaR (Trm112 family)
MKVLPLRELAAALVCPMCRGGALVVDDATGSTSPRGVVESGERARCARCGADYGREHGVLSFLVADQLSETNRNEIAANTFEGEWVERMLHKEDWSPLHTHQMQWVIELVDHMLPAGLELFVLGAGTGFDLQLLLRRRSFERVYASDIAPAATALIARALEDYAGELGLFASEFGRCPVAKRPGSIGLVFQALHHAPDAHAALAALLDHNFDELVIVEPVTNPPLGLLARFDLVQRVEYTGTRPDWLRLARVEELAASRGFTVASRTWWEIPPYLARTWVNDHPRVWRSFYRAVDAFSRVTNAIRFGSMAAVHLSRRGGDASSGAREASYQGTR